MSIAGNNDTLLPTRHQSKRVLMLNGAAVDAYGHRCTLRQNTRHSWTRLEGKVKQINKARLPAPLTLVASKSLGLASQFMAI